MYKKLISIFLALSVFAFVGANSVYAAKTAAVGYKRPKWVVVSDKRVNGNARCHLKAMYRPDDLKSVRVGIAWKTSIVGGWHVLSWGDGNLYGTDKKQGAKTLKHPYGGYGNYGSYNLTFTTDDVDGNEATCSVNINLNFVPPVN